MVDPQDEQGSILLVDDDKDVREFLGQALFLDISPEPVLRRCRTPMFIC
jgi:hypothetical protein